jgi:hypothetical protein
VRAELIEIIRERLAARESRIGLVPPAYLVFIGLPAEINNSALALIREIYKPGAKIFNEHSEVLNFLDRFTESNHVGQVCRPQRTASAKFSFLSRQIDLKAHADEDFALLCYAREQAAQSRYEAAGLAQRENSFLVNFVKHPNLSYNRDNFMLHHLPARVKLCASSFLPLAARLIYLPREFW